MEKYADAPDELEAHLQTRTPEWAAAITGLGVAEIEAFAHLVGKTQKTFFRLGYGFTRQRNGTASMHAVSCIPVVAGHWQYEGGGAFHNNGAIYGLKQTLVEGRDVLDETVRVMDQSRIGAVLTGEPEALRGRGPVKAILIQNTNPMAIAPDQAKVRAGFAREDLFTVVHEHFMTDTAKMADIVLPATMFLEHDDLYPSGGNQHLQVARKLIEPPGECRSNHDVICAIAARVGAEHKGFAMSPRELIDATLQEAGHGGVAAFDEKAWRDLQPDFRTAHFLDGFAWPDGKFRFRADWQNVPFGNIGLMGPWRDMPSLPDHWAVTEEADADHPFRLATSPARNFLNSSFTETPTSLAKEGRPQVLVQRDDAEALGIADGDLVLLKSQRGEVRLHAKRVEGQQRGVLVSEGVWPNHHFIDGKGINTLTGDDSVAPFGGAAVHDTRVDLRKL